MPDWLNHVLFAWALWNILSLKFNMPFIGIFITGSLLPDIDKVEVMIPFNAEPFLSVFHTPVGALITSGVISMAILRDGQAHVFLALGIGSISHLLLDLMVKSMDGRVMLFFPFSFVSYSLNIIAQKDFMFLYLAMAVFLMSFIVMRYHGDVKK